MQKDCYIQINDERIILDEDEIKQIANSIFVKKYINSYRKRNGKEKISIKLFVNVNDINLNFFKNVKSASELLEKQKKDENKKKVRKVINKNAKTNKPSQYKKFTEYKKKNVKYWVEEDFIGFYLNKYVDITGREDHLFVGPGACNKSELIKFKKAVSYTLVHHFCSDKDEFKKYIFKIMKWIVSKESWTDGRISFYSIFGKRSRTFVNVYFDLKYNKKKEKDSRKKIDDTWSNQEAWIDRINSKLNKD